MLGSKCNLKIHVRNLTYTLALYKWGGAKPFFGQLRNCLKKVPIFKLSVTLSNLNCFSKFLYCCTVGKRMKFATKPIRQYPPAVIAEYSMTGTGSSRTCVGHTSHSAITPCTAAAERCNAGFIIVAIVIRCRTRRLQRIVACYVATSLSWVESLRLYE